MLLQFYFISDNITFKVRFVFFPTLYSVPEQTEGLWKFLFIKTVQGSSDWLRLGQLVTSAVLLTLDNGKQTNFYILKKGKTHSLYLPLYMHVVAKVCRD